MKYLRKSWLRVIIIIIIDIIAALLIKNEKSIADLRPELIKALQGVTVLFGICSGLSLMLFSNYIRGVRDSYYKKTSEIRDLVQNFYDEHKSSKIKLIVRLRDEFIEPLLCMNIQQWVIFDEINTLRSESEELFEELGKHKFSIVARYLLRLEDEINELGRLLIVRIVVKIYSDTVVGTFLLIIFGVVAYVVVLLAPDNVLGNSISVFTSLSVIGLVVLELYLLLSHLEQLAKEEFLESDFADPPLET